MRSLSIIFFIVIFSTVMTGLDAAQLLPNTWDNGNTVWTQNDAVSQNISSQLGAGATDPAAAQTTMQNNWFMLVFSLLTNVFTGIGLVGVLLAKYGCPYMIAAAINIGVWYVYVLDLLKILKGVDW
jgi:hypothetical protein